MVRQAFAVAPMVLFAALGCFAASGLSAAPAGNPESQADTPDWQIAEAEFIEQILATPAGGRLAAKSKVASAPSPAAPITPIDWTCDQPYVVEPPDMLLINCLWPTLGIAQPAEATSIRYSTVICPDGTVAIPGSSPAYVAGLTIEGAQAAIQQKIDERVAGANITIDVLAANSKNYYVIIDNPVGSDTATVCPCTGNDTVLDAIAQIGGLGEHAVPEIRLCRPAPHGVGMDQVLPIDWEALQGGSTATNYQLGPSDRLFITTNAEPQCSSVAAVASAAPLPWKLEVGPTELPTCGVGEIAAPAATIEAVVGLDPAAIEPDPISEAEPFAAPAPPEWRPSEGGRESEVRRLPAPPTPPAAPQPTIVGPMATPYYVRPGTIVYSAPQPVSYPPMAIQPSTPVPPQRPPAPVAAYTTVAFAAAAPTQQIHFNISVVEDPTGSFAEFEPLREQPRFMIGESKALEGTMRILEKHRLVNNISNPQLVTTVGRPAVLEVGSQMAGEDNSFHGVRIELSAREIAGGLVVDFKYRGTARESAFQLSTSLFIPHGHTVIMQGEPPTRTAEGASTDAAKSERALYLVLTPSLVK